MSATSPPVPSAGPQARTYGSFTAREWLSVYATKFRIAMAIQLHYRASLGVWLIGAILQPVIFVAVWSSVARAQGGSVNGLTEGDFAAYFIVAMIVNQLTFSWIFWEYEYYIREGQLASRLLRPVHPIHGDIADNITYKVLTLVIMVPATILLIWAFRPVWNFQWWALLAFLPALLGAFLVRFLLEYTLAMAAFWTTRVSALNQLYGVIFLFFSGGIAPLQLLPGTIQSLANLLPFRWTLAFPIELLLGQLTPRQFWLGMGAQAVWLLVALALLGFVWRAGVRRFASVGG